MAFLPGRLVHSSGAQVSFGLPRLRWRRGRDSARRLPRGLWRCCCNCWHDGRARQLRSVPIRQDRTRCMDRASPDRRDGDVHRGYRALGCTGLGPERPKRRCREPNRRRSLSRGPVAVRLRVQTGGCRFRLRRRACRLAGRQSRRVQPGGRTARGWRPRLNLRPLRSTAVCHSVKPQR